MSKSNEWYTPTKYIEAARKVMGSIDLDPASCFQANQVVKAERYFDIDDNGLTKEWHGNIWLNPPYGRINPEKKGSTRSYQLTFGEKLLREYAIGNVEQAILLLLGNACFTRWFQQLWDYPLCFHSGYIVFNKPDGTTDDFGFGTIFVYLGPHEQKFIDTFSHFGRIVRAIDAPRPKPINLDLWHFPQASDCEREAAEEA